MERDRTSWPWNRWSASLRHRIFFLIAGNSLLLGFIYARTLRDTNSSFVDELVRFGPNVAPNILAGLGLTGIVCAGAMDLSIGAIIVVAGTVFGILYDHNASPAVCFLACFATAFVLSTANGFLVRISRLPAIIVTLAGLTFYRGLALVLAELGIENFSGQISIQQDVYHAPGKLYAGTILLAALVLALAWEAFGKQPRMWLALGNSPEACRRAGLSPGGILQSAFAAGGLFLGLAAVTYATNRLTIEPSRMARNFELDVIGAVVLGGTNIFGGEGSYLGTALGGCFLYLIGQTMFYAGVGEDWRTAVQGAVIVSVIGIDCLIHRRRNRLEELR